jgi:hypothetical protein
MADAILDGVRGTRSLGPPRDTLWQHKNRNVLKKVNTQVELTTLISELRTMRATTFEGMNLAIRGVLAPLCWEEDMLELFLSVGRLPTIAARTYEISMSFLLHIQSKSLDPSSSWEMAKVDLRWFATKIERIRIAAPSRLFMLAHVYAFLRDADDAGYTSSTWED